MIDVQGGVELTAGAVGVERLVGDVALAVERARRAACAVGVADHELEPPAVESAGHLQAREETARSQRPARGRRLSTATVQVSPKSSVQ